MKNWKVWTSFLTVFVAGVLVGVLGVGIALKLHFAPPRDQAQFHNMMRARILGTIKKEVRPDPAAIPAIEAAIDQSMQELETIRKEMHPRIKGAFDKGKERIKAHLTPEQRKRFDAVIKERREGKFDFFRLPPPPPPMP